MKMSINTQLGQKWYHWNLSTNQATHICIVLIKTTLHQQTQNIDGDSEYGIHL